MAGCACPRPRTKLAGWAPGARHRHCTVQGVGPRAEEHGQARQTCSAARRRGDPWRISPAVRSNAKLENEDDSDKGTAAVATGPPSGSDNNDSDAVTRGARHLGGSLAWTAGGTARRTPRGAQLARGRARAYMAGGAIAPAVSHITRPSQPSAQGIRRIGGSKGRLAQPAARRKQCNTAAHNDSEDTAGGGTAASPQHRQPVSRNSSWESRSVLSVSQSGRGR